MLYEKYKIINSLKITVFSIKNINYTLLIGDSDMVP